MEAIGSAVIDGAKTMFKFTFSRVKTLSKYEENILELRKKIVELRGKRMAIEEYISLARLEGKTPKPQVNEWLKSVSRAEDDVKPLLEMPDKMMHQYLQCWTVAKKLELVKDLISTHFDTVSLERSSPIIAVQEMAVASLVGQGAASHMKRLLEILNRDDITRIAVWGMGGIGKTTLVKNLNNRLRVSTTTCFDIAIWVQVSRWFDVRTIQSQIANRIHLKVEEGDTDQHTANRILRTLKWIRKILLILDDVWEKIDLDAVGIPPRDPRCKVLLTTRSRDVCRRMVVDVSLQLNLMNDKDSWDLFVQSVGSVLSSDGIESPARKIAASFHGLPLPIKTV